MNKSLWEHNYNRKVDHPRSSLHASLRVMDWTKTEGILYAFCGHTNRRKNHMVLFTFLASLWFALLPSCILLISVLSYFLSSTYLGTLVLSLIFNTDFFFICEPCRFLLFFIVVSMRRIDTVRYMFLLTVFILKNASRNYKIVTL